EVRPEPPAMEEVHQQEEAEQDPREAQRAAIEREIEALDQRPERRLRRRPGAPAGSSSGRSSSSSGAVVIVIRLEILQFSQGATLRRRPSPRLAASPIATARHAMDPAGASPAARQPQPPV